jgi:hypothetical protein
MLIVLRLFVYRRLLLVWLVRSARIWLACTRHLDHSAAPRFPDTSTQTTSSPSSRSVVSPHPLGSSTSLPCSSPFFFAPLSIRPPRLISLARSAPPPVAPQVARDICGTPLRPFWPYVKDPPTIARVRQEQVFEVGACWNGIVAFPAELVAWPGDALTTSVLGGGGLDEDGGMDGMDAAVEVMENVTEGGRIRKRGWQMVDNGEYFLCSGMSGRVFCFCAVGERVRLDWLCSWVA